jgi:hypothetical protein
VIAGVAAAAAYFSGILCKTPLKLCPPGSNSIGTLDLAPSGGPGMIPNETNVPLNGVIWRTNGKGYGDYGDYGYYYY